MRTPSRENREGLISRLPKWVQAEIQRLERDVESLEKRVGDGPADSDTILVGWSIPDKPLGSNLTVRFVLDPSSPRSGYIECNINHDSFLKKPVLCVRSSDTLAIVPGSSNSIYVFDRER